MAMFKYQDFLANVRGQFLPRSDRFEVMVTFPSVLNLPEEVKRQTTLFCEEAQIPGLSGVNVPLRIGNWTEYRNTNVEFLGAESVFTFVCDQGWKIREAFESWVYATADPVSKETGWQESVQGSFEVFSLDVKDEVIASWRFYESVPKLVNLVPVSSGNPSVIRLSVSVASNYWERTK